MKAKKSLGQNFLKSKAIINEIVASGNLSANDIVVEVGPGKGALTESLLEKAGKVIAVEKDSGLLSILNDKFAEEIKSGTLVLINEDILDIDIEKLTDGADYKVIANIPYYITGLLLRYFLEAPKRPSIVTFLVQKEIAERIVARDKKESILSISVKVYGSPKFIKKVPARYFSPAPKVDSAILCITDIKSPFENKQEEEDFFNILKTGFAHKRKLLKNNLSTNHARQGLACKALPCRIIEDVFEECGISLTARAENVSVEQWLCLAEECIK